MLFSGNRHTGPIHLQADSAFEASSTGLRPVNWPDFYPGKNRPINWPEADWEASSEAEYYVVQFHKAIYASRKRIIISLINLHGGLI